ncbi:MULTISPECIES: DUF4123 domain-containing protein [unclassified Janthinobacterium]|uniref:DUF4123 domain-containing protein n=1 Tax=unclassified Janthinobacterium TaxID=2610881 RepID=UPI001E326B12|nr:MULTISPECIES: DUF4123 domain-containing protein [unclassified Janthinobacterium]MCC7646133.1 DUF4123 domain-containing protein [Janthinobacterium sp. EB271-G4-3-1]MCC7691296.1 DUF4123 domain-containing protein [Janthinobacterium sp. EB271-G4-3-2]
MNSQKQQLEEHDQVGINMFPSGWKVSLHMCLQAFRCQFPEAHIYALIDGVFDESCYPLLKRTQHLRYEALFSGTPGANEETLSISPLLVEFDDAGRFTWERLLEKTNGHPALSLIVTPEPLNQLAARLAPWCIVDAADYTVALSFADTRVLPQLFKTLTAQQLGQFCGPAHHWQYVTRKADWSDLALPGEALPAAVGISFSEQQCAQLMRTAEADGILFQVRATSPRLLKPHPAGHAHALVEYWLACADHARLEAPPDRFDVCLFGLENPGLEARPQLASWLAEPARVQVPAALFERWMAERSSAEVPTLSVETKS